MGNATIYAPQSVQTHRQTDFVQRVISTVSGWFRRPQTNADAGQLTNALRRDIGLAPVAHRAEPIYTVWLP